MVWTNYKASLLLFARILCARCRFRSLAVSFPLGGHGSSRSHGRRCHVDCAAAAIRSQVLSHVGKMSIPGRREWKAWDFREHMTGMLIGFHKLTWFDGSLDATRSMFWRPAGSYRTASVSTGVTIAINATCNTVRSCTCISMDLVTPESCQRSGESETSFISAVSPSLLYMLHAQLKPTLTLTRGIPPVHLCNNSQLPLTPEPRWSDTRPLLASEVIRALCI